MKQRTIVIGAVLIAQLLGTPAAFAGPWEDGMAAYNRGDYVPAIRVFRRLAEQGNAKAQNVLGVMFRKGRACRKIRRARICGSALPRSGARPAPGPSCARCRK